MNITESEAPYEITAKTCGCKENGRKVIYSFVESFHNLSKDKKDILISEIHACERLRKYARDELDKEVIESEISDLKMALDLLTQTWTIRFTDCKTYDISYLPDRSFESIKTREEIILLWKGQVLLKHLKPFPLDVMMLKKQCTLQGKNNDRFKKMEIDVLAFNREYKITFDTASTDLYQIYSDLGRND